MEPTQTASCHTPFRTDVLIPIIAKKAPTVKGEPFNAERIWLHFAGTFWRIQVLIVTSLSRGNNSWTSASDIPPNIGLVGIGQ